MSSSPPAADPLLNRPIDELPARCDVLVVGAGPAGSAAAQVLAHAGFDVVLIDRQAFPRDKVCGDGLIPDSHHALRRLGVLDEVLAQACAAQHVAVIGPRGGRVDVPGTLAVLPRRQLDLIVCRAAVAAGAQMHAPVRFVAPLLDDSGAQRVVGARVAAGIAEREIRCDWVVLASGAVPQALQAVGLCERRTPSAVALRGYVRNRAMTDRIRALEVVWHPKMRSGYGWIFPCGDGLFNIGVGVEHSHSGRTSAVDAGNMAQINLRQMMDAFGACYRPAGELIGGGSWLGEPKGAPLRCSLAGAGFSRPGLLVTGEAAGSTFAFTGEGIGKALETGMLAAQALIDGRARQQGDDLVRASYEQQVRALQPRFAVYDRASVVNRRPWLVDLVVWSAKRSPSRLQRMSGVLEETYMPSNMISARRLLRLVFDRS